MSRRSSTGGCTSYRAKAAPWVTPERLQGLRIVNLVGEGPIWAPEPGRHISTMAAITATGERLRRLCEQEDARLLVVDPLAAAYASDENARGLVRAFVSHWDAWGQANNCTVLMLAHPPKSAGVNYAGSTDWQGAASRIRRRYHPTPPDCRRTSPRFGR